ncbi:MAG TPA: FtsX-like permease family protein [Rhizomicrobium sp.]|nr:FtsX-like permease family protein [Rhizomicrobium sp.]
MLALRQIFAVTLMNLRTIPARLGSSLVVVIGMACAVGALVSILSMSAGFVRMMTATGSPNRAIILSDGALGEWGSTISRDTVNTVTDMPGIKSDAAHKRVVSADYVGYTVVTKKSDGTDTYLTVRGVGKANGALRPEIKLVSGRMFRPGQYELITGAAAQGQFDGLKEGDRVTLPEGEWLVTGTFESNGSASESELITDSTTLLSAMRMTTYKSLTVLLDSPDSFARFKTAVTSRPGPALRIERENDYYLDQSKSFNAFLTTIAYVVGGIMGLGAVFGALNTMYSAVASRTREIATLRAVGFGAAPVVVSVMAEALLLCLAGACLGIFVAWLAFNGNQHSMGGMVIRFAVSPALAVTGAVFACVLGLAGGLFPGVRAARLPVADALRAV